MTLIKVEGSDFQTNPECPLCKKVFDRVPYKGNWYYICKPCEIFIDVKDPSVHAWASYVPEDDREIFCPNPKCGHEMNFFFRADQYMKAMCPKCYTSISLSEELALPKELIAAREKAERDSRTEGGE